MPSGERHLVRFFPAAVVLAALALLIGVVPARAQGLGGAGTIQGTIKDPNGGGMVAVAVELSNPVSGFKKTATTDSAGKFVFQNLPQNHYHLEIIVQGYQKVVKDVDVRSAVAIDLGTVSLAAAAATSVEVEGHSDLVETTSVAHTDVDTSRISKLVLDVLSGVSATITLSSPGVVADSNGFFHPIGDHAQTQFSIDNQPVTDQQSRAYSNQISPNAVQSMEIITGVPPAEFGDKDSLVVRIVTKSGLDQKPSGDFSFGYGSFKSPSAEVNVGIGNSHAGNFLSYQGTETDRYLDPPEFVTLHDHGQSESLFDRVDAKTGTKGTFHMNVQGARSSFDVPNTYDQDASGQAQHQTINTVNVAPGYATVMGASTVLTVNGFVRQDRVNLTPSANEFADTPATVSQARRLTNLGGKADVSYLHGAHNLKFGATVSATRLAEVFALGITDPTFNSPCVDATGAPSPLTALTTTGQCAGAGLSANSDFVPGLLQFDLTRKGSDFNFNDTGTIKQESVYVQDEIKAGEATFNLGVRVDHYAGLSTASLVEPRLGVAYQIKASTTILRASYGRTLETPYNENLLLSSSTGANGLTDSVFGVQATDPLQPGKRDQFEAGVQQGLGRWLVADFGVFKKHTVNAYDFDVLLGTPIVFPISWDHSDINGFTGRATLVEHRGFSAFMVFGHTNAHFFNPENGGLLFDSPLPTGEFRIDHDQKFQQTTNLQYTFDKAHGAWVGFTWRYDSGLVAGAVTDYATAMMLTADDQAAIGLYCGSTFATPTSPITSCASSTRGATRVVIPADGTEDDDTNPPRIAPRNLFDMGFGVDNLFGGKKVKAKLRVSIVNLTNKEALYNFLSTFSGTHFVAPRAFQVQFGVTF